MPALVKGSVFPPIPFKVTVGTRYSLHVLMSESKVEWPMDTEPQESRRSVVRRRRWRVPVSHCAVLRCHALALRCHALALRCNTLRRVVTRCAALRCAALPRVCAALQHARGAGGEEVRVSQLGARGGGGERHEAERKERVPHRPCTRARVCACLSLCMQARAPARVSVCARVIVCMLVGGRAGAASSHKRTRLPTRKTPASPTRDCLGANDSRRFA